MQWLGWVALAAWLLAACAPATAPSLLPTLSPTAASTQDLTPSLTPSPRIFASPQATAAVPIPPPLTVSLPEEVRTLLLLGSDSAYPYAGRTDAIALVFYHPRLGRASLLSLPPDLYVYLPGFTMQRLNSAYALGGIRLVEDALDYNLGIRPDHWVLVHLEDFVYFVDDLNGLEMTVIEPPAPICSDIPPGTHVLNGDQVMCYLRVRQGDDELERNARQQQVLFALLQRLVHGGTLARLPEFYATYSRSIESNIGLADLVSAIPLLLRIGSPDHLGMFRFSPEALHPLVLSESPRTLVFLPNREAFRAHIQDAIDYVTTPAPFSEVLPTMIYELTVSPTPTLTPTLTLTPTPSPTPEHTATLTPSPSATASLSPTLSSTPTVTPTP